ncbi:MAG: 50S ribosomal protein L30 [Deltaproteobacteria bacterium]|nr:50S ribosomal protein L30 [Deltaproteobacteria bacterium]MBF0497647.1 50S ribosomal protein L30 [Deltaproteobacteria bacterium]
MSDLIKVKLVRSGIGRPKNHKLTLKGLGLTRMNKTVTLKNTPAIRGMIRKVIHLVEVME